MSATDTEKSLFLGRTDQLDAKELDSELSGLMTSRIDSIFKYFGPEVTSFHPLDRFGPEMNVAIKLFIYYWTIFKSNASTGQQILKIGMAKVRLLSILIEFENYNYKNVI